MVAYTLGVTPLIQNILEITSSNKLYSKEIEYDDDFTVAGLIEDIKCYWKYLNSFATLFGYYPKSIEITPRNKGQYLEAANVVFGKTKINLTSKVMRNLGAVIGDHYKEKYLSELVTNLNS